MAANMLYSIVIFDEPNTADLRNIHRKAHLDYLQDFDAQTLFAGPFTTDDESADLGSLRLIDFPDLAAVERHIANEPYVTGGIAGVSVACSIVSRPEEHSSDLLAKHALRRVHCY